MHSVGSALAPLVTDWEFGQVGMFGSTTSVISFLCQIIIVFNLLHVMLIKSNHHTGFDVNISAVLKTVESLF